jgi:enamine deaminase RidA (YjgF/YER057c/UK114 family)
MKGTEISSSTNRESKVGYSRVVRLGSNIYVAGTTATDELGKIIGKGDPYVQTIQIIKNIDSA